MKAVVGQFLCALWEGSSPGSSSLVQVMVQGGAPGDEGYHFHVLNSQYALCHYIIMMTQK